VLRYVKPQHFLPVHGEYSFLVEHARLAKERAGVLFTEVRQQRPVTFLYAVCWVVQRCVMLFLTSQGESRGAVHRGKAQQQPPGDCAVCKDFHVCGYHTFDRDDLIDWHVVG
jgi:hypothetical protein